MSKEDYRIRKWNSLTQFKNYLEKNKLEKVIAFNGALLETNKAYYGLYAGDLSVMPKDKK